MKGMLLAAGLGTRLRPITDAFAKPAVPFLNIPLLYYPVVLMEAAGAKNLVINTHYKPEQIQMLSHPIPGFKGTVNISPELEKPLGSGGGVWAAKRWLDDGESFILANADEVIIPSNENVISKFKKQHFDSKSLATIFVTKHPGVGTQFGGVWTDKNGLVHGFGKQKPASTETLTGFHYIGLLILSNRVFRYLPEGESNLLYDALMNGIKSGERVEIFEDNCSWFETGNPEDFLEATRQMLESKPGSNERKFFDMMGARFWSRKPLAHAANVSVEGHALLSGSAEFVGESQIKGFAVVGDDCLIGRNCVIEDSILMPGSKLADGTKLRRQIVLP